MLTIQEFRKQAKALVAEFGLSKSDISITTTRYNWIHVYIYNLAGEKYIQLMNKIEKLAGFINKSDAMTDYFEYKTQVLNNYGSTFTSILISRG